MKVRINMEMKSLDEPYRDLMWSQRKYRLVNLPELAVMLNCKHEHMVAAQTGKPIPGEVYDALIDWLES